MEHLAANIKLEKMLDRLPLPTIEKDKILDIVEEITERSLVDG